MYLQKSGNWLTICLKVLVPCVENLSEKDLSESSQIQAQCEKTNLPNEDVRMPQLQLRP